MSKNIRVLLEELSPTLSAGVLSANLSALGKDLELLENCGVRMLHFDVMDGHFVPALTVGDGFVKALRSSMLKDVHLMIQDPAEKIASYATAGADMITVHVESSTHIHRALQCIGEAKNSNDPERGIARGLALNPGTSLETVAPFLDEVDVLFLLAVNPGYSGQKFISSTTERFRQIKKMLLEKRKNIVVGIDGGVTRGNIAQIAELGPDIVVSGSALFDGKNTAEHARNMLHAIRASKEALHANTAS